MRVSTETYAARSTFTKEKKLTSPPSRRSFAKRSPSTVLASRNLRGKRSPKGFRPVFQHPRCETPGAARAVGVAAASLILRRSCAHARQWLYAGKATFGADTGK